MQKMRKPAPPQDRPSPNNTDTTTIAVHPDDSLLDSIAWRRRHGPACWTRRHDAAVRLPVLDCGCADPWTCRCRTVQALSDNQIDGYADAARYILDTTGCTPILPIDVLRRLWQRGGDDRALAEKIQGATNGAVA